MATGFTRIALSTSADQKAALVSDRASRRVSVLSLTGESLIFQDDLSKSQRLFATGSGSVRRFTIQNKHRQLVAAMNDGRALVFDLDSLKLRRELRHSDDSWVNDISFSPDGTHLLTTGIDAKLWRIADGELVAKIIPIGPREFQSGQIINNSGELLLFSVGRKRNSQEPMARWELRRASNYNKPAMISQSTIRPSVHRVWQGADLPYVYTLALDNLKVWRLDTGKHRSTISSGEHITGLQGSTFWQSHCHWL